MALADALASIAELYGGGARLIEGRKPDIEASAARERATLAQDSAARQAAMSSKLGADAAGLLQGAQNMNIGPVPVQVGGGIAARRAQQAGNAAGWDAWIRDRQGIAAERNQAQADLFRNLGDRAAQELEADWAAAALRGGGGGRGGGGRGGGGGYGDDEALIEFPRYAEQIPDSGARALAAARIRLEDQSSAFKKAGYSGPGSAQKYGSLLAKGMLSGGSSSNRRGSSGRF